MLLHLESFPPNVQRSSVNMESKKQKSPELKLIDEPAPETLENQPVEEGCVSTDPKVTRLEVLEKELQHTESKKRGPSKGPKNIFGGEELEVQDEEEVWINSEPVKVNYTAMVVAVVVGAVLLSVTGWVLLKRNQKNDAATATELGQSIVTSSSVKEAKKSPFENTPVRLTPEQLEGEYNRVHKVVDQYLRAATIEEKYRFVRQEDVTLEEMRAHYERYPLEPSKVEIFVRLLGMDKGGYPFYYAAYKESEESDIVGLVLQYKNDGEFEVDWKSHVGYSAVDWEEFRKGRVEGPTLLRVYAKRSDFYSSWFNEKEFFCVRLWRGDGSPIYAYLKKDNPRAVKLQRLLSNYDIVAPCIMKVQFKPDAGRRGGFLIEEFVSGDWLHLKR